MEVVEHIANDGKACFACFLVVAVAVVGHFENLEAPGHH
jgi:hypothetical protein